MDDRKTKIIVFIGVRDGAGVTTLAASVALILGKKGEGPVLLVDADDLGANDMEVVLGRSQIKNIEEVKEHLGKYSEEIIRGYLNLDGLGVSAVRFESSASGSGDFFYCALAPLYKWIVIDAGSNLPPLTKSAVESGALILLVHSDDILSPNALEMKSRDLSMQGISKSRTKKIVNKVDRVDIDMADLFKKIGWHQRDLQNRDAGARPFILENLNHPFTREISALADALADLPWCAQLSKTGSFDRESLNTLKDGILAKLHERVEVKDVSRGGDGFKAKVREILWGLIEDAGLSAMSQGEKMILAKELLDDALSLGPLEELLSDPAVVEIMVNGKDRVYVERDGRLTLSRVKFRDASQIGRVIERILAPLNRRVDESSPMVDARLPDGSRVNIVIPPLSLGGPLITIRKFKPNILSVDDLVRLVTMNREMAEFFRACVRGRLNILISGGTGTGKTTFLNLFSSFISKEERIVTIEDSAELKLKQDHVVSMEARTPNIEGKGAVTIRDLVRNALRMRPDRIIVGECRGGEALDMLQAMNTGHDGSMTTIHANSPRDSLSRLLTLVMFSGLDLPIRAIREQISSAIDLIIHLARLSNGSRKVLSVTEITGMEGEQITMQEIFTYSKDCVGGGSGFVSTGFRPKFQSRLVWEGDRSL